jgi:hypothetical protein
MLATYRNGRVRAPGAGGTVQLSGSVGARYWQGRLGRWPVPKEQTDGYSVLVPVPGDPPVSLSLALAVCRHQQAVHRGRDRGPTRSSSQWRVLGRRFAVHRRRLVRQLGRGLVYQSGLLATGPEVVPQRTGLVEERDVMTYNGVAEAGVGAARREVVDRGAEIVSVLSYRRGCNTAHPV